MGFHKSFIFGQHWALFFHFFICVAVPIPFSLWECTSWRSGVEGRVRAWGGWRITICLPPDHSMPPCTSVSGAVRKVLPRFPLLLSTRTSQRDVKQLIAVFGAHQVASCLSYIIRVSMPVHLKAGEQRVVDIRRAWRVTPGALL